MRTDRPPDEKTTPPGGMTPEQLDEHLEKKLGTMMNNMWTARIGTFEKKLKDAMGATVGDALKAQLPELLKDFGTKTGDDPPGGKKGKDVELDSLRRQMNEMSTALQEQKEIAAREVEKGRKAALEQLVVERLGALGQINGTGAKLALMALTASGRVRHGNVDLGEDPERVVFIGDDRVSVDLDTGLRGWFKSDEAKFFQAPSGARGSGSRPAPIGTGPSGPVSREQAGTNAMGYLAKALQNEFRGVDVVDDE